MARVAICVFPLNFMGGVATRSVMMAMGARAAGHDCDLIRLNKLKKHPRVLMSDEPQVVAARSNGALDVQHIQLSYAREHVRDAVDLLNKYDLLVFAHAAPHPSTDKEDKVWQLLYSHTRARKVSIFSDVFWEEGYPWIKDVIGHANVVHGTNQAATACLQATGLRADATTMPHPFAVLDPSKWQQDRLRAVVWACQWRGWKGLGKVLWPALPALVQRGWSAELYGSGWQEYGKLKETPEWGQLVAQDHQGKPGAPAFPAKDGKVNVYGTASPAQVERSYRVCTMAADFTGGTEKYVGHYNRTTIEPMGFGCLSMCRPAIVDPHSFIPKDAVVLADTPDEVVAQCERVVKDEKWADGIRQNAWEWVRPRSAQVVMKQLVDEWMSVGQAAVA